MSRQVSQASGEQTEETLFFLDCIKFVIKSHHRTIIGDEWQMCNIAEFHSIVELHITGWIQFAYIWNESTQKILE